MWRKSVEPKPCDVLLLADQNGSAQLHEHFQNWGVAAHTLGEGNHVGDMPEKDKLGILVAISPGHPEREVQLQERIEEIRAEMPGIKVLLVKPSLNGPFVPTHKTMGLGGIEVAMQKKPLYNNGGNIKMPPGIDAVISRYDDLSIIDAIRILQSQNGKTHGRA